jgi:hypothetical protein
MVPWSEDMKIVDARYLHEGEEICPNMEIEFPCHVAVVGCSLNQIQNQVAWMPLRIVNPSMANWSLYSSTASIGREISLMTMEL